ncbi:efflux RND transporter permease subunit, partial [Rhizobium ruizarguesonis]
VYDKGERGYAGLIGSMTRHAGVMALAAIVLLGVAVWGLTRLPPAFLPVDDHGYVLISAPLPDSASKERPYAVVNEVG